MYNDDFNEEEVEEVSSNKNTWLQIYEANKKLIWIAVGILVVVLLISLLSGGCSNNNEKPQEPPKVVIVATSETIGLGNSMQIIASVMNIPDAKLSWFSNNESVAKVDKTGIVTALSYGKATITVTYEHTDGKVYRESCSITVADGDPNVKISNIEFQEGEVLISQGQTFKLPLIIKPSNGYLSKVSYLSSNKDIVTVDQQGNIKAISEGRAGIKVSVNNGEFTDEIAINVTKSMVTSQIIIFPTTIGFEEQALSVEVGKKISVIYNVLPSNADKSYVNWESSNPSLATVDGNGVITGVKAGTVNIIAKTITGVYNTISLEVVDAAVPVTGLTISKGTSMTMYLGGSDNLAVTITPDNATNKAVSYTSSNPSVVSVDLVGNVQALSVGTSTITVKSTDSNITASITITVIKQSSSGGSSSGGSGSSGNSSSGSGSSGNTTQTKEGCYLNGNKYYWGKFDPNKYTAVEKYNTQGTCTDANNGCYLLGNKYYWGDYGNNPSATPASRYDTKEKCESANKSFNPSILYVDYSSLQKEYLNKINLGVSETEIEEIYYCVGNNCKISTSAAETSKILYIFDHGVYRCFYAESGKNYKVNKSNVGGLFIAGKSGTVIGVAVKWSSGAISQTKHLTMKTS